MPVPRGSPPLFPSPLFPQPPARRPSIRGRLDSALHEAAVVILDIGAHTFLVMASGQRQGGRFRFQQTLAGNSQRRFAGIVAKPQFHGMIFVHSQRRFAHFGKRREVPVHAFAFPCPSTHTEYHYISQPTNQQNQEHPGNSVHFPHVTFRADGTIILTCPFLSRDISLTDKSDPGNLQFRESLVRIFPSSNNAYAVLPGNAQ